MPACPRLGRKNVRSSMLLALPFALACDPPPDASEPFSDAAIAALGAFNDEDPATLVRAFEQLEVEIGESLDLSGDVTLRSLTPADLTEADVADMTHPDRDPGATLPVALAWSSPFAPTEHDRISLISDQVPEGEDAIEPFAIEYTRTFTAGEDCFPAECEFLRSRNDMTKENPSMTVPLVLMKDWRAFELSDGRAARASRGWMEEGATELEGSDRIEQSYAIELWTEQGDGTTLRLLVLWAETTFEEETADDLVVFTTRIGMDTLFRNHDGWIEAH